MANEMGNKALESETNESQEKDASYRIVNYPALSLPQEYRNLVIAPFLNSLRYGNDLFKLIDQEAYYFSYGKYVESLMQRPSAIIKLAMLDDSTVIGWCLMELKTVHYVFVKKEARRKGICQALLPKEFDIITHITNKGLNIWSAKYPEVRFDPFK